MICEKCGEKVFMIDETYECDDCKYNGAWNTEEEGYTYSQTTIDVLELVRDQVEEEGECLYGRANNGGCYMITCLACKHEFNIPCGEF